MSRVTAELKPKNLSAVGQIVLNQQDGACIRLIPRLDTPLPEQLCLDNLPAEAEADTFCEVQLTDMYGFTHAKFQAPLGKADTPGIEKQIACLQYGLPEQWTDELLQKARQARQLGFAEKDRVDLTNLPFITIDDEGAKDHDDAVYCEQQSGHFKLWVAIADVSHYVSAGSALDKVAAQRGTSVYFPTAVLPMLPELLSTDLCSLKPQMKRPCLVCEMIIDNQGQVDSYRFYKAIIQSAGRLTYEGVESVITKDWGKPDRRHLAHSDHLHRLRALYQALMKARKARGAVEVDLPELQINFDQSGHAKDIGYTPRGDAHRLIENCMIIANVCAALFLQDAKRPGLYRIHAPPAQADHLVLAKIAGALGIRINIEQDPVPKDYQKLTETLEQKSQGLSFQILRAMAKAQYSGKPSGHFGLALEIYTHFTSPIRRYADLLVHRTIKGALFKEKETGALSDNLVQQINIASARAEQAERFARNWLKCTLMQNRVGETFDSRVFSVQAFGLIVELASPSVQGLVHISTLGRDYFHFNERKFALVGERTRKTFQSGDKLRVKLVQVDQIKQQLSFVPAEYKQPRPRMTKRRKEHGHRRRRRF